MQQTYVIQVMGRQVNANEISFDDHFMVAEQLEAWRNFQVSRDHAGRYYVDLIRIHHPPKKMRITHHLRDPAAKKLQVLISVADPTIMTIDINNACVLEASEVSKNTFNLRVSGQFVFERDRLGEHFHQVFHAGIEKKNSWARLPTWQRRRWLETVVQTRNFSNNEIKHGDFVLDGEFVTDCPGFFLAFGEAINGPGGYYGRCLDSLYDCFCGDFGAVPPFTLIWKNADVARAYLDQSCYLQELIWRAELNEIDKCQECECENQAPVLQSDVEPFFDKVVKFLTENKVKVIFMS